MMFCLEKSQSNSKRFNEETDSIPFSANANIMILALQGQLHQIYSTQFPGA